MRQWLEEFIAAEARRALTEQQKDGSMPAGCNGPYGHPERPLRNTAHWLITWCHCYRRFGDTRFADAARGALDYLLRAEHRPAKANWWQRDQQGRDRCNGTIGAAWVIEALCHAWEILEDNRARKLAIEVYDLHPFDAKAGLWKRVEIDGSILSFDQTFNHQLWFAAAAGCVASLGHCKAGREIDLFMDRLKQHFAVYPSGLIQHRIDLHWYDSLFRPGTALHALYLQFDRLKRGSGSTVDAHVRDVGYHAFNLHAFAALHRRFPNHPFWESASFRKAVGFARSPAHERETWTDNPYAYAYNPVGFETAFALEEFAASEADEIDKWLRRQISVLTLDGAVPYGQPAVDSATARARIYEALPLLTGIGECQ